MPRGFEKKKNIFVQRIMKICYHKNDMSSCAAPELGRGLVTGCLSRLRTNSAQPPDSSLPKQDQRCHLKSDRYSNGVVHLVVLVLTRETSLPSKYFFYEYERGTREATKKREVNKWILSSSVGARTMVEGVSGLARSHSLVIEQETCLPDLFRCGCE